MNDLLSQKTKDIYESYKTTLKTEKSRKEYYYIINAFCQYTGKDYLLSSESDFKNYFKSLEVSAIAGNLSYKTLCSRYSILINFSSYIVSYGYQFGIKDFANYMTKIPPPKMDIKVQSKSIPTMQQLDEIYSAARQDTMMYCIISLVNKCALTIDHICNLKKQNVRFDTENNLGLIFPYQYRADKFIKLPQDVYRIMDHYYRNVRQTDTDYFFVNTKGNKLSKRMLQIRMKKIVNLASGNETWEFSLQDIRNLSAVLMLKGGADKEEVANYLSINPQWIQRYEKAVEEFSYGPCDCINISIKPPQSFK